MLIFRYVMNLHPLLAITANERDVKIGTSCRAHNSVSKHMNQYCEIRNDCAHFDSLVSHLTLSLLLRFFF